VAKYDYFLLDVDVINAGRSGSSKLGEAKIKILTRNARPVEAYDSQTVSADDDGCHTVDVTTSAPGRSSRRPRSAVRWLRGRSPTDDPVVHGQPGRAGAGSTEVDVPSAAVANDDCTQASDDWCKSYDRGRTVSYSVNTDGCSGHPRGAASETRAP
jgi:hypothetical protein